MSSNSVHTIKGIKNFPYCPVCGKSTRSKTTKGIASIKADAGHLYLQYSADKLKLSMNDLLDKIKWNK